MEKQTPIAPHSRLKPLRSGDPNSAFRRVGPADILSRYGPPLSLLSTSAKAQKCLGVGVLARVLFLTPGIFCPDATPGCLRTCLGHTSGRMQMPTHSAARDRRAAYYLEHPSRFLAKLKVELTEHFQEAARRNLCLAVRLNGTSDLPWETLHPELFNEFPHIRFFDYTRILARTETFLVSRAKQHPWPANYHLTFSVAAGNHQHARRLLRLGGNVAVVFWPNTPSTFWGCQVIDGDRHDARFLDPRNLLLDLRVVIGELTGRPLPDP